jgi:hypothetical protein
MRCHGCARPQRLLYAWSLGLVSMVNKNYRRHLGVMRVCRHCLEHARLATLGLVAGGTL